VYDGETPHVDDRRENHVLRVDVGFEDRAQAGVGAQGMVRIVALAHHFPGTMEDRVGEQFGASTALLEPHAGQPREVQQAQDHDDRADDRRDA
jgi:hypothetical protein